jgi:hypothetical protein
VWKDIVGIFVSLNNLHGRYKFNYLLKVLVVYTSILYYEDNKWRFIMSDYYDIYANAMLYISVMFLFTYSCSDFQCHKKSE